MYDQWEALRRSIQNEIDVQFRNRCALDSALGGTDDKLAKEECALFHDYLKRCHEQCKRSTKYKNTILHLNDLVADWDDYLKIRRTERGWNLEPWHRFFISDCTISNEWLYTTKYAAGMPPDRRVIHIGIDRALYHKETYIRIMHEVGHFVGFRNRSRRYGMYFLKLLGGVLCKQIGQEICKEFFGFSYSVKDIDFLFEDRSSYANQQFTRSVREALDQSHEFLTQLIHECCSRYEQQWIDAVRETESIYKSSGGTGNIVDRQSDAVRMKYFDSMRNIHAHGLCDVLQSKETWCYLGRKLYKAMESKFSWHKIYRLIKSVCMRICDSIENTITSTSNDVFFQMPPWYLNCEKHFEEVAADLFMIWCLLGLQPTKRQFQLYVDCVLKSVVEIIRNPDQKAVEYDDMVNAAYDSLLPSRIFSVCSGLGLDVDAYSCIEDKIRMYWKRFIPIQTINIVIARVKNDLKRGHEETCNKFENCREIHTYQEDYVKRITSEYAEEIWSEYKRFETENKSSAILESVSYFRRKFSSRCFGNDYDDTEQVRRDTTIREIAF